MMVGNLWRCVLEVLQDRLRFPPLAEAKLPALPMISYVRPSDPPSTRCARGTLIEG